jgi:hypothetical protein
LIVAREGVSIRLLYALFVPKYRFPEVVVIPLEVISNGEVDIEGPVAPVDPGAPVAPVAPAEGNGFVPERGNTTLPAIA